MASLNGPVYLAAAGSTGNGAFPTAGVNAGAETDSTAVQIIVEAVGGTPTCTFQLQGSIDGTNWFNVPVLSNAAGSETTTATTLTAVGASILFVSQPLTRCWQRFRVVSSANTNVTFRVELYTLNGAQ